MDTKFLHNHPQKEKTLGIDENHVIVDREDWEQARQIIKTNKRIGIIGRSFGFDGSICGVDEAKTIFIDHEHVIRYPILPVTDDNLPFKDIIQQERYIREVLGRPEVIEQFKNLSMQLTISAENLESLSEELKAYDRENNPKKQYKGHERPYKFHR